MNRTSVNVENIFVIASRRKLSFFLSAVMLLFVSSSCKKEPSKLFVLKKASGIEFNNRLSPTPELNILTYLYYYNGGGVASGDFNNDGLIDLYFTGNQVADKLYLNQGELQFEDITVPAGINNAAGWTNGVSLVDINHDGLLDLYICKVGHFKEIRGQNLLYINQGPDQNGTPHFKEEAKKYGLDIKSFATQAAFFDYDLDGDLDMYLLNHSVHPNRTYGKGSSRNQIDSIAGDKLFENQEGHYVEVSEKAGIYQGKIGYGLGLGVSDLNNDGYPDLYIGNDFFENDYLYINQKDGTFKEVISEDENHVGHTSHFSMGNDLADVDNDGWADIISLDMLPEDPEAYKSSGREYNNQIYEQYLKNGYRPQFMQNAFLRNNRGQYFQEMAFASGIAASDWSWAPLVVDLDNDGHKDIFISNGILGATNDMDFINFIANNKIQEQLNKGMEEKDLKFTEALPRRHLSNLFFKNNGDLNFSNMTESWFGKLPSFSNGSVYADLDNDGDQDLVVNNVNESVFILENLTDQQNKGYLKIKFKGPAKNTMGIGARIHIRADSLSIHLENYNTRGYLSSVAPELTAGLGTRHSIDTLQVIWPDGKQQQLLNVRADTTLILDHRKALSGNQAGKLMASSIFENKPAPFQYKHKEPTSYEFGREPLIPYSKGAEGPKVSVSDVNGDGLDDIYLSGGKGQSGVLFVQNSQGNMVKTEQPDFDNKAQNEETDHLFFDADNDGDMDLVAVSGGNEALSGTSLQPVLYLNAAGQFNIHKAFTDLELNAAVVKAADIDKDGDMDLIMGANALPRNFGRPAENYLLLNDGHGNFKDVTKQMAPEFGNAGLIESIEVVDLNKDGLPDLIAAGHWMPISVFVNNGQGLELQQNNNLELTHGLWNTIRCADFDLDGDLDIIAGNWGQNSMLKASATEPMQLYINDFDGNEKEEALLTYYQQGKETVFSSKDDLVKQIPVLNKKFLSYAAFAKAEFSDLFEQKLIDNAIRNKVYELSSCYFENKGNGSFEKISLPFLTQISSVKTIYLDDFNQDGFKDALLAGNDHMISTQLGRLDAGHGLLLINDQKGSFLPSESTIPDISGKARDIESLRINNKKYLIITLNDASPLFLEYVNKK